MWQLRIRNKLRKIINKFPKKDSERIHDLIKQMSINPYDGDIHKLSGNENVWRRRTGSYRIFYELILEERILHVFNIERRNSNTY